MKEREKCIRCDMIELPIGRIIIDDWDRLCHWCILEFEGFFNYNIQDRKE